MGFDVQTFRLNASGLRRVLGDLEADVMECLWARGEATVGEIRADLAPERSLAFNTVMTVMNRLVDKQLVRKTKPGRPYRYSPAQDRETFLANVSGAITRGLVQDFGDYALSQFASALAQEDPDKLDELEQLVAEWKARRK